MERLLRFNEVKALVGLSRTTIWRLEKAGLFPMRVKAGENSVAWIASEISKWIEEKSGSRDSLKSELPQGG